MARLDDYDVILDVEFLRWVKASIVLHLEGIHVLHEKGPGWVSAVMYTMEGAPTTGEHDACVAPILASALATGVRRGEMLFIMVVAAVEATTRTPEVLMPIQDVLEEF